ncbi:hypothetical protein [Paenibacillus hubeiensis]|uniref:hypothetical protein n=1 Tax=Paenibacillus hubeiensis TaxID=3077330 RepID=UPI0031BAA987
MRKQLDICNLSGQLGISSDSLHEWLRQHTAASESMKHPVPAEREAAPYRLVAPDSLTLAPFANQPKLFRGRRPQFRSAIPKPDFDQIRRVSRNY